MDEHDLTRLLRDAAASPSSAVDQTAIDRGVTRRRRRRHTVVGATAAALVLVAGLAAFSLLGDDADDLQLVETPTTSTTATTEPDEDEVAWASLESIPPHATFGIAVQQDDGIVLVELDGREGWTGRLRFGDLAELGGLDSEVFLRLPITHEGDLHWWDPSGTATAWHPTMGLPLAYGGLVGGVDGFLRGAEIEVAEAVRWWVSSDMRVLTWTECESGCPYRTYDSLTGEVGELLPGCWVAAKGVGDELGTLICADGTQVVPPPHDVAVDVGTTAGNEPARALAAWPNGVVWLDHGTCHAHEAVQIVDGEVRSLLHEWRAAAPSAIPLGVAPDGRMIVHLNAAACDAADPDMGVYLVDLDTSARELVWAGAALPGDVRAWAPPAPRPMVIYEGTTEVELVDLESRFLVFGSDGIAWLDGGGLDRVWSEPVAHAFPDGMGGVVFQEVGDSPFEMDGETGAIRWLAAGSPAPADVIGAGERAELHQVLPLDGEPTVLYTRRSGDERSDSVTERLFARGLRSGVERDLGRTGGYESYLDAVALTDAGMITSTCHLQCTVRHFIDEAWDDHSIVEMANWISGLDAAGTTLAFVELEWHPSDGTVRNPTLVVGGLDGEGRRRVRLSYDPDGSQWWWVDLAPDARSALAVTPRHEPGEDPRFDVVLVTGLDTDLPRVQIVRTDHALRFG